MVEQFFVNLDLLGDPQAIRHFDDVHTVKERLIVFVVTEGHPFRFVRVGEDNPVKRQGGNTFRPVVVPLLGGGQQRMQHFDRCFKHLDEFHNPLVGTAQRTGIAVGIRVVLRVMLQLTDIDFTHQRRDILVVLVTGFCFGNGDLLEDRRPHFHDAEFGNVPAKLVQTFCRPRRHDRTEIAMRNAKLFFQNLRILLRIKQAQRMVIDRAALAVGAQHIDRHALHQRFQPFSQGGFTPTDRTQQVKDLLLLFQPLSGMLQVGDDLLNGIFHAIELFKRRVSGDHPIRKETGKPWLQGSINHVWLTNSHQ